MSQSEVMRKLECSAQTVQRWDKGTLPHKTNIRRLCALFQVDETELLKEEPTPEPDMTALLALVDKIGVEKFAYKMNLAELSVAMWREGAIPQISTLRKIAARLRVPVTEFLK